MRTRTLLLCALVGLWALEACDPGTEPPPGGGGGGGGGSDPGDLIGQAPPDTPTACQTAYTGGGFSDVCSSCACGKCPDAADACAGGTATEKANCLAVVACQFENDCHGMECFCGGSLLCGISPSGPCIEQYRTASGVRSRADIQAVLDSGDTGSALVRAENLAVCAFNDRCLTQCTPAGDECTFEDEACQERYCGVDAARETARLNSSASFPTPDIDAVRVNGTTAWTQGSASVPTLRPGDTVVLEGTGFGSGVDVDFAKIMIGNSRVLETDLRMFEQKLNILTEVHHEEPTTHSTWDSDLVSWTNTRVEFRVPVHVSAGPIRMQVQKRIGNNESLTQTGSPHSVVDAQTLRIIDPDFEHQCDVVSELGQPQTSNAVPVNVVNTGFDALMAHGQAIFWGYDYNIGLTHDLRGLDWEAIFDYAAIDPITGGYADPEELFGAVPAVAGQVPAVAYDDYYFDPYPMPSPVPGLLAIGAQLTEGNTSGTGWVGYRYAEGNHPYQGKGEWIGFNCASCHGYRVSYERAPGEPITRVIPGLPNPRWTMKWTVLGDFEGVRDEENGPAWEPGAANVDKTALIYGMPPGTGEHNIVRLVGEGSHTDNDYQFSPIAIPNVTNYMPIRRSLSHTESYVGFEGSYIHSEEPDGALGSMGAEALQALTAYMTVLDQNDDELRNVGVYRWLASRGEAAGLTGGASEGAFVQNGWQSYAGIADRVANGAATFADNCASCHSDGLGAHTNERMIRLDQVGRYFTPTIYQRHTQSIRVSFLRDLYWTQHRGLLTDGHVRNLEDLVNPDRCTEGTALYDRYYTVHPPEALGSPGPDFPAPPPGNEPRGNTFRLMRSPSSSADDVGAQRNRFIERHKYFVTVPWDPDHYYWDYQAMRAEYGPDEIGSAEPIGMPAAPHPWCASSQAEVDDLVLYLLTL